MVLLSVVGHGVVWRVSGPGRGGAVSWSHGSPARPPSGRHSRRCARQAPAPSTHHVAVRAVARQRAAVRRAVEADQQPRRRRRAPASATGCSWGTARPASPIGAMRGRTRGSRRGPLRRRGRRSPAPARPRRAGPAWCPRSRAVASPRRAASARRATGPLASAGWKRKNRRRAHEPDQPPGRGRAPGAGPTRPTERSPSVGSAQRSGVEQVHAGQQVGGRARQRHADGGPAAVEVAPGAGGDQPRGSPSRTQVRRVVAVRPGPVRAPEEEVGEVRRARARAGSSCPDRGVRGVEEPRPGAGRGEQQAAAGGYAGRRRRRPAAGRAARAARTGRRTGGVGRSGRPASLVRVSIRPLRSTRPRATHGPGPRVSTVAWVPVSVPAPPRPRSVARPRTAATGAATCGRRR